jgi:hypothetical protein
MGDLNGSCWGITRQVKKVHQIQMHKSSYRCFM